MISCTRPSLGDEYYHSCDCKLLSIVIFLSCHMQAARAYGYTLVSRSPSHCTILTPGNQQITFEVLHVLEFDSNRKCMSVLVRRKGDPRVILYSKGADSVIYRNLAHRSGLHPVEISGAEVDEGVPSLAELTQMHLNMYARLGLRTLCLAKRVRGMYVCEV